MSKRKIRLSYKDLQILFLTEGVTGVDRAYSADLASKTTIRRALRKLRDSGHTAEELEKWVLIRLGGTGRGRAAPVPGEKRNYKAQQIKTGGPFLRLPLDVLGIKKGQTVLAQFRDDCIVITGGAE